MKYFMTQQEPVRVFTAPQRLATPSIRSAMPRVPSHEDIAMRAYEIYVENGRKQGHGPQDWQQAERELEKAATAGPPAPVEAPPVARVASPPVQRTVAGASPPITVAREPTRPGMTPLPYGGRGTKA